MWWLYFAIGADTARHNIEHSDDPGRVARAAFTYVPVLLVAGIVVAAVADELVLAHPLGHHADLPMILTVVGGPALYVTGNMLFKYVAFGRPPLSHMVGLGLFVVLAAVASYLEPLPLSIAATMIIIIVAAWEFISMKSLRR
jgi:low temperature requirement protein LtrA